MKLGSLFDGIGGFPLSATYCGIEPVWASEIEPAPVSITKRNFPKMKHLGDITKINGAEVEPVDIITFGSPCQDLSVAGKRAGLKHEDKGDDETTRSGLFMEAVRIIKEMRVATNEVYPTVAVWENVPGAFSSNKGEDFQTVLEEICKVKDSNAVVPRPEKGKWADAGYIVADGFSIAWRILDAQFWGVPQRRRRIYLVADFAGQRAAEILFEQNRSYWHTS
jgi:DNA (cytosine-5)-methyltransferase 1